MKVVEPSFITTNSRSSESLHLGFRSLLIQGKTSTFDQVFPMFDQMFQHIRLPSFLYSVSAFFMVIHVLFTAIWPFNSQLNGNNSLISDIVKYVFFVDASLSSLSHTYIAFMFLLLVILVWCWFVYVMSFYSSNHRFLRWTLYPVRFSVEILCPLLIHPVSVLLGLSINKQFENSNSGYSLPLLCSAICYISFISIMWVGFLLESRTSYMQSHVYSVFDSSILVEVILISSISIVFSFLFRMYSDWTLILIQVGHAGIMLRYSYALLFIPFHQIRTNIVLLGTLISSFSYDILNIAHFFVHFSFNNSILLGFYALLTFLSMIISHMIVKNRINNFLCCLADEDSPKSEEERFSRVLSLGIDKNADLSLMLLRLGLIHQSSLFIDFSLIKAISQFQSSNDVLCTLVQFVSFFPSESRLLNALFSHASSKRDLEMKDRFLMYEVHRIKTLRQSSTSLDANERLSELKSTSIQCESISKSFWNQSKVKIGFLDAVSDKIKTTQALWEEGIRDYPNNPKFCDEYCRFLTEALCDFENAIFQKQRSDMIELGKNYAVDICFRSFVRSYPDYIKKKILDTKGNNVSGPHKHSQQSPDSPDTNSNSSENHLIDADLEESIGKQLFNHTKMRLALERALNGRKPAAVRTLPLLTIINLVLFFVLFYLSIYLIESEFVTRKTSLQRIYYLMMSRFYSSLSGLSLLLNFANKTGRYSNYSVIYEEIGKISDENKYILLDSDFQDSAVNWMQQGRTMFNQLLFQIATLSSNGYNIYEMSKIIINKGSSLTYCAQAELINRTSTDLGTVYSYHSFLTDHVISIENQSSIFQNDYFCEQVSSWGSYMESSNSIFELFNTFDVNEANSIEKTLLYIMYIAPVTLFLLQFLPIFFTIVLFIRDSNKLGESLLSFDDSLKREILNPIRRDIETDCDQIVDKSLSSSSCCIKGTTVIILGIFIELLFAYMIYLSIDTNQTYVLLNKWQSHSVSRVPLISETAQHTLMAILLNGSIDSHFNNQTHHISQAKKSLLLLESHNRDLLQGNSQMKPCFEFDTLLDQYNFGELCTPNATSTHFHDLYRCSSSNQNIGLFSTIITEILQRANNYAGRFDFKELAHGLHLINSHLFSQLENVLNRLMVLASELYDKMILNMTIILASCILLCIIWSYLSISLANTLSNDYEVLLSFVRRVPPQQIINHKTLLNIILNKDNSNRKQDLTISGNVIQVSIDAIICTGLNGVVEMVNPSVSNLLGYTPEQLLGQPISLFFSEKDVQKLENQVVLMKEGQSSMIFEEHMTCISDDAQEIPCSITILGMKGKNESNANSFVFILRDETELKIQQEEAEKAKAQSESLLYQILPREIVMKLNRGEKDVSFSVPSATIIFIDIVKFSEFSAHLTPQDILEKLSIIFSSFDRLLEKYNLLTKIKLIGDVYMAASGLFGEVPEQKHAEQMVHFAIDSIQELEDLNVRLNSNINVRIGINSGGPILAGVLGTDKPVFDIIGDPINIAARLQATCIPGRIQISQGTYDLIHELNFEIEKRGEVFLKGKGNATTYFVNPGGNLFSQLSSTEIK